MPGPAPAIILSGTQIPGGTNTYLLSIDASGFLVETDPSTLGFTVSGDTNNRLITADGAGGGVAESGLTFDGTTFTILSNLAITASGEDITLSSTGSFQVVLDSDNDESNKGFSVKNSALTNQFVVREDGDIELDANRFDLTGHTGNELPFVIGTAKQDGIEIIKATGATDGYLSLTNNANVSTQFEPQITGLSDGSNWSGLYFAARIPVADDTGTNGVMRFQVRQDDSTTVDTRPCFIWDNLTTRLMTLAANGDLGIGTTPSAQLHVLATTEQLRLGYDASNYYSTTVGSTGGVTFDAVGSGAGFTFSDNVTLSANKTITLNDADNSAGVSIDVPTAVTSSYTLTLPAAAPSNGQVLQFDGSANASFNYVAGSILEGFGAVEYIERLAGDEFGNESVTNSGTTNFADRYIEVDTNATATSTAYRTLTDTKCLTSIGKANNVINWSKRMRYAFMFVHNEATTNGASVVLFGRQQTDYSKSLDDKGLGIRIENSALRGVVYAVGETEVDLSTTLTTGIVYAMVIECDGAGNVEWFLNGSTVGSTSSGPTGDSTVNHTTCVVGADNGGDAAAQHLTITPPWIVYGV